MFKCLLYVITVHFDFQVIEKITVTKLATEKCLKE